MSPHAGLTFWGLNLTCYPSNGHLLLLWRRHGHDDVIPVECLLVLLKQKLLLLLLLLRQWYWVMVAFPLTPILERDLGWGSTAAVPEVHGSTPSASVWAEEQRIHNGAGHELDDARRACLLAHRAAWAGSFSGRRAAPVRCSRGNWQRVHVLRQVMVAVGELGERLQGVFTGRTRVVCFWRRSSWGWLVGGARAVPQLDGWWMLGKWFRTTWSSPYRF